ncbi:type IX secretion system sortase PorU [Bacteroidales bacterium AH-315-N07]|nr:type IX secretion system sortase PorU [Bacteroidales bacterium AH-315-N07]
MKVIYTILVLIFISSISGNSKQIYSRTIKWGAPKFIQLSPANSKEYLHFDGAIYFIEKKLIPFYKENFIIAKNGEIHCSLLNEQYQLLKNYDLIKEYEELISSEVRIEYKVGINKKSPYALVSFIPIRKNLYTGLYEKLISFDLDINIGPQIYYKKDTNRVYAENSVLSTGNWYKIGILNNGVYKLTYSYLSNLGVNISAIDPKNLRIYGNGGGMLPQSNSEFRYDDLVENAIYVSGEEDSKFNQSDYILFYAQSPHQWNYDTTSKYFQRQSNIYSDTNFYFITADLGVGKRISSQLSSTQTADVTITTFDDYAYHDKDKVNLIKSGRIWYGEEFDLTTSQNFTFSFPNIVTSSPVILKSNVVARSKVASSFSYYVEGNQILALAVPTTSGVYTDNYVEPTTNSVTFNATSSTITINLKYSKPSSSSIGWLNYIELNSKRKLIMSGDQMLFRNTGSVGTGNISNFLVSNSSSFTQIWDVTDPVNVKIQESNFAGEANSFNISTDSLKEFVAFTGNSFLTPALLGKIGNQNLHGEAGQPDLIIISHPDFITQAQRLAGFHKQNDNFDTLVITPQAIYNEFSSGKQDISAIRDFLKMLYDRAGTNSEQLPRYLLLFGDASYDYKDRISGNTNFIPSYQSVNSNSPTSSHISDDYYGFLDDNEGAWLTSGDNSLLDIGIGRLPVKSFAEAKNVVDKIIHYKSSSTLGDWRNVITFVADDEDNNTHINDADILANEVDTTFNNYNIHKIYFDSYTQFSTSGGERYPDANKAINNRIQIGTFLLNYTGHGGEVGWAHERVLGTEDIKNWENYDKLTLFFTATCEFSRFDDPERTSAGEMTLLNPNGGAIALCSTVRLVYSFPNFLLNRNFYRFIFRPEDTGEMPRLGDVFRNTKNASGTSVNNRNFTLLGDPALKLNYPNPKYKVLTSAINGKSISNIPDTLKAFSKVTISAKITDETGQTLSNFNGIAYPTIYDKPTSITTLGNNVGSYKMTFKQQNSIIYKGKATVTNGTFNFTFIVPKDISYNLDYGRISYYADNGIEDASGSFEDFMVGGTIDNYNDDKNGPTIDIFLNDENFVFGGMTDQDPLLIVKIEDESGINTVGNGIGHDITALLNEDYNKKIILNEFYEAALDDYQKGEIKYKYKNLNDGNHKLTIKVWDVYNNSSEENIEFTVASSASLALDHVLNYPNPFTTSTTFQFEHNKPGQLLEVEVKIYTISGKLIKSLFTSLTSNGNRVNPIQWNGLDEYGDKIGKGVYIYRLKVSAADGDSSDKYEKLVILN